VIGHDEPEEERIRRDAILRDRALSYARIEDHASDEAEAHVLLFRLGDERYAIELRDLLAVRPATGITHIPCTPPHIAGILNVRGDVISVVSLSTALELRSAPHDPEEAQVLLVARQHEQVGLLVDEVLGVRRLSTKQLERPLSGRDFARGVAEASIVCLDLESLLTDDRFEIDEEVT
jgi:purine-binding chemotaxis protein CheW